MVNGSLNDQNGSFHYRSLLQCYLKITSSFLLGAHPFIAKHNLNVSENCSYF